MTLESPDTYGEHYWKQSIDASKLFADESEKVLAPLISSIIGDIPDISLLPMGIQSLLSAVREPTSFAFLPLLTGIGLGAASEAIDIAFEPLMLKLKRDYGKRFKSQWLSLEEANTLWLRKKIPKELWNQIAAGSGYEDEVGSARYEAEAPYPTIPELVSYSRYHGVSYAPWGEFTNWYNIAPRDWPVWKWLAAQKLSTLDVQNLRKRELLKQDAAVEELTKIGWEGTDREVMLDLSWTYPNAMLMVQGNLLQDQTDETILADISKSDIHPSKAKTYLDAVLTKPPTQDIIAYLLRQDPTLSGLDTELKRIGIHPNYNHVYKELAYQIPPVADIITMAVREAFTPEIAAKFGQYQDLPPDFVTWAGKKGLSEEWATRYWASHWSLPSPLQGFEMLHRGVIDQSELSLLLRALDIMPFWRDKLIQISYNPLTRIDIRRMYNLHVLSLSDVKRAYQDIGYNEENAERLTVFTNKLRERAEERLKKQEERAEEKADSAWSASQTLGFLKDGIITPDRAVSELRLLGYNSERITTYLVPVSPTWTTTQTLGFLKKGLIEKERAISELQLLGYNEERINVYIESTTPAP